MNTSKQKASYKRPDNGHMDILPDSSKFLTKGHMIIEKSDNITLKHNATDYRSELMSLYDESYLDNHMGNLLDIILNKGKKILFIDGNNISVNDIFLNEFRMAIKKSISIQKVAEVASSANNITTKNTINDTILEMLMEGQTVPSIPVSNNNIIDNEKKAHNLNIFLRIMTQLSGEGEDKYTIVLLLHNNIADKLLDILKIDKEYHVYMMNTLYNHGVKVYETEMKIDTKINNIVIMSIETPADEGGEYDDYLMITLAMAVNDIVKRKPTTKLDENIMKTSETDHIKNITDVKTIVKTTIESMNKELNYEISRMNEEFPEINRPFPVIFCLMNLEKHTELISDMDMELEKYINTINEIFSISETIENKLDYGIALTTNIENIKNINNLIIIKKNCVEKIYELYENVQNSTKRLLNNYYSIYNNQSAPINVNSFYNYDDFIKVIEQEQSVFIKGMLTSSIIIEKLKENIDYIVGYNNEVLRLRHRVHLDYLVNRKGEKDGTCKYLSVDRYAWLDNFFRSKEFIEEYDKIIAGVVLNQGVASLFDLMYGKINSIVNVSGVDDTIMNTAGGGRVKKTKIKMRRRLNKTRIMKSKTRKH
jgi:hypothetical protein